MHRVLIRDREGRLRPVRIQSEEGQRLLASIPEEDRLGSFHLVGPGGEVHSAGAAAAPLVRLLPRWRRLAPLFERFPGATERLYHLIAANRGALGRLLVMPLLVALAALALAACSSEPSADARLRVYVSAPLRGPSEPAGRDLVDGAELALERAGGEAAGVAVELEPLDSTARGPIGPGDCPAGAACAGNGFRTDPVPVAANAREAIEDSTSIAYIGELGAGRTRFSLPITNEAGLGQISPGPVAEELLREDPGGSDVPEEFQSTGERTLVALRGPGAGALEPEPSFAAEFEDAYGREPSPAAAYGFESMALTLDAIERADDPLSRGAVVEALLATADRDSVLGTYSIDPVGLASIG